MASADQASSNLVPDPVDSSDSNELNPNPYCLKSGDNPGSILVTELLIGRINYPSWSRAMVIALTAKNKIEFINGVISKPEANSPLYKAWTLANTMVLSWIYNSVNKNIKSSVMYNETARQVWLDLKHRFAQGNAARIYSLQKAISHISQNNLLVSQFHTDLSLFDLDGKEKMRKTISVNDPLRYGGVTIYQTDWSFSALQILKDDEGPFNLAMAPLKINGEKKLFGTFLPVGDAESPNVKGISMLARDLQSIVIYDLEGKFSGVRRPGSKLPIDIDGSRIVIVDAIGSSGLDLMTDPGVPIVYAGFGALMLTTCISFLSHSRIWALQDGTMVIVGGKTNRAKAEFPEEMDRLLDRVPEIVESSRSKEPDKVSG